MKLRTKIVVMALILVWAAAVVRVAYAGETSCVPLAHNYPGDGYPYWGYEDEGRYYGCKVNLGEDDPGFAICWHTNDDSRALAFLKVRLLQDGYIYICEQH